MKRYLTIFALWSTIGSTALVASDKHVAPTDDRIYDQVRMRLTDDPDVKGGALDVTVKNGVVKISGRVTTEKGKSKATKLAKKVKGVTSVDNELTVGPPTN
ncbi:MAG: BON domain-containing protein [Bryobacteraceae bacterium]